MMLIKFLLDFYTIFNWAHPLGDPDFIFRILDLCILPFIKQNFYLFSFCCLLTKNFGNDIIKFGLENFI